MCLDKEQIRDFIRMFGRNLTFKRNVLMFGFIDFILRIHIAIGMSVSSFTSRVQCNFEFLFNKIFRLDSLIN